MRLIGIALVAALACGPAIAQQGPSAPPRPSTAPKAPPAPVGNGMDGAFAGMDSNRDGSVSKAEHGAFQARMLKAAGPGAPKGLANYDRLFAMMDADSSGAVSKAEFMGFSNRMSGVARQGSEKGKPIPAETVKRRNEAAAAVARANAGRPPKAPARPAPAPAR